MKILFLIKGNYAYGGGGAKSGLLDSAKLTAMQLIKHFGIDAKVEICIDGNDIDREVFIFKPDICVIEAIWVTPAKVEEITKLHPKTKFYIRVHSEIPFLATEGIAMKWLKEYPLIKNVIVCFNSSVTTNDFNKTLNHVIYLPNLYSYLSTSSNEFVTEDVKLLPHKKKHIDIASFGALRPMKNQLLQAFAAIEYGNIFNKIIHFNINAGRTEQGGDQVLKNIRYLFEGTKHTLVEHAWLSRGDFLELVSFMDIGLQISFSESFNIVTADFVRSGIPIIVSHAVRWMPDKCKVGFDVSEISDKINHVLSFSDHYIHTAKRALNRYNDDALEVWEHFLNVEEK